LLNIGLNKKTQQAGEVSSGCSCSFCFVSLYNTVTAAAVGCSNQLPNAKELEEVDLLNWDGHIKPFRWITFSLELQILSLFYFSLESNMRLCEERSSNNRPNRLVSRFHCIAMFLL
jgi:hypothetical protein